ncbi:SAM-dependent methyltransferase, partial [Francisella tularensis]|uniref:SAM-dependent methyltransferase n=1 Tax=Francisella tularensis TaxID=263 RepID=UPI003877EE67
THLNKNDSCDAKVFQGQGSADYLKLVRESFKKVILVKTKYSRAMSRKYYVNANEFTG